MGLGERVRRMVACKLELISPGADAFTAYAHHSARIEADKPEFSDYQDHAAGLTQTELDAITSPEEKTALASVLAKIDAATAAKIKEIKDALPETKTVEEIKAEAAAAEAEVKP